MFAGDVSPLLDEDSIPCCCNLTTEVHQPSRHRGQRPCLSVQSAGMLTMLASYIYLVAAAVEQALCTYMLSA
jgi:hypothetical protein